VDNDFLSTKSITSEFVNILLSGLIEVIKDPNVAKNIAAMDRRSGWGSNLHKVRR